MKPWRITNLGAVIGGTFPEGLACRRYLGLSVVNLAYVGNFADASFTMENHIAKTLRAMGHTVRELQEIGVHHHDSSRGPRATISSCTPGPG